MSFDLADFKYCKEVGLNPFGTGQCLSTVTVLDSVEPTGLNPFGTGQCLSTFKECNFKEVALSQSLWNRAMSFDHRHS